MSQAEKWDRRFADAEQPNEPTLALAANAHLLPAEGTALDLACGVSGNGLLLARSGLTTHLWDSSQQALSHQEHWFQESQLSVVTQQRDCETNPPRTDAFDVICVAHFLHRPLNQFLIRALKPGGLLFYQTFCEDKLGISGPSKPEHLLAPNELLQIFANLQTRFYREDGSCGDLSSGERSRAFYVGQKVL